MSAGRLLVLEGTEGAGKSTQIARLADFLTARDVPHLVVREPGGTAIGEEIPSPVALSSASLRVQTAKKVWGATRGSRSSSVGE